MNKNLLKIVLENKGNFVPWIFTEKQYSTLNKYNKNFTLTNAEKKSLYTSIKKKMEALNVFDKEQKDNEYYISGYKDILPKRLLEAKKLIGIYSKKYDKVFVSGSFLFSKEFNDIDIFIVREKGYKEEWKDNIHIVSLTEKKLSLPVFQSASLISISNFQLHNKIMKKRPLLSDLMSTYHEAVIEYIKKDKKPESIRRLIFDYYLFCHNKILNPKELKESVNAINIDKIDNAMKELCIHLFSKSYLYVDIHGYIKTLEDSIKNIQPNEHLKHFKERYEEMLYGKQGSNAQTT